MNDISDLKLRPLNTSELAQIADDFEQQCILGMKSPGKERLMMLPSYLRKIPINELGTDAVLAMDIGGSFLRIGIFKLSEDKQLSILPHSEILEIKNKTGEIIFDEYIRFIAQNIKDYLDKYSKQNIDRIGLTFSFAANIIQEGDNIDISREGYSENWGKDFLVAGSEKNVSLALRERIKSDGVDFVKWVGLNDVTALNLADYEAMISLVVGTGYNIGVVAEGDMIVNTQAGSYINEIIQNTITQPAKILLDEVSRSFGVRESKNYLNEIFISGGFLYRLLIHYLLFLCEESKELLQAINNLKSKSISIFLSENFDKFEKNAGIEVPNYKRELLTKISKLLRERSTDLVSAQLAGAISYSVKTSSISSSKIIVAADGTMIKKMPKYREMIQQKTSKILDNMSVEVKIVENSALQGAAIAGLSI